MNPNPNPAASDELALAALGLLDDEESLAFEQQLAVTPGLDQELRALEATVGLLAYAAVPCPAPDLKQRLLDRINPNPQPMVVVRASEVTWRPTGIRGITVAPLSEDKAARQWSGLLRLEAGVRYPLHRHVGTEEIYMLSGDFVADGEVYGPGDYLCSAPGSQHAPHSEQGCMLFFRACLDDQFLELAGCQG